MFWIVSITGENRHKSSGCLRDNAQNSSISTQPHTVQIGRSAVACARPRLICPCVHSIRSHDVGSVVGFAHMNAQPSRMTRSTLESTKRSAGI